MARRLISFPVPDEAGNRLGGSGTEVRLFTDTALTALLTVYANDASVTTLTQPLTPNAGAQTTLTVSALSGDTTITVASVAGIAVGNLMPIYDGTNTRYRCVTAINAGTRVLTLDSALGVAFSLTNTLVGNADMIGHIHGWGDDATDWFMQAKNVASTRVLPPLQIPAKVPASAVAVADEGTTQGTRMNMNFIGTAVKVVDNAGSNRVDVTVSDRVYLAGVL